MGAKDNPSNLAGHLKQPADQICQLPAKDNPSTSSDAPSTSSGHLKPALTSASSQLRIALPPLLVTSASCSQAKDEEPAADLSPQPLLPRQHLPLLLLLDDALSRLITVLLDLLRDVLKEEVMRYLDQRQMELVDTVRTLVKVLAVASSSFSCFNLLALVSISMKHRLAHWLMLPHLLTGSLFSIFVFLLPCTILSFFQPLTLNFPSVMAFSALLICLFRILIQEFETLVSLAQHMQDRKVSGLRVWRNIVPDIETDRVFLVSRPVDL